MNEGQLMFAGHLGLGDFHHQAAAHPAPEAFEIQHLLGDGPEKHLARTDVLAGEIYRQPQIRWDSIEGPQGKNKRILGNGDIQNRIFLQGLDLFSGGQVIVGTPEHLTTADAPGSQIKDGLDVEAFQSPQE